MEDVNKHKTWTWLRQLRQQSNLPWLDFGDLNEILYLQEKKGGQLRESKFIQVFHYVLHDCKLHDIGFTAFRFTWTNGRVGTQDV
jgi:hypothetical protein